jgi:CDP-6-deoxy-D-xylo-4-hexulose-3-dehydrase
MKISAFKHPLMFDNITLKDRVLAANFLKKNNIFTQSKKVKEFEKKWSNWLGVKYSIFVNSGSSANFLTFAALNIFLKSTTEVIVPPLTWNSDIVSILKNGFRPKFVDINLKNLSMNYDEIKKKINKNTKAIFITHAQGFNGLSMDLLSIINKKKILLVEDVCESHGAKFKNKKLGTFGIASNFSFYYAHHLSTIEGGMICTNNKKFYETIKMLRGHGMLRESGNKNFENKIIKANKDLSPKFIFLYPGFNMRNNEISAVIGLNQLKRLDKNNKIRAENLKYFLSKLNKEKFIVDFDLVGNSNYAFPVILKTKSIKERDNLEKVMNKFNIEFRRGNAGGGNQIRQPYLKNYTKDIRLERFKNVEHVHYFGYYIGNYPALKKEKIYKLALILNNSNSK